MWNSDINKQILSKFDVTRGQLIACKMTAKNVKAAKHLQFQNVQILGRVEEGDNICMN